jgi:hypothetical protein
LLACAKTCPWVLHNRARGRESEPRKVLGTHPVAVRRPSEGVQKGAIKKTFLGPPVLLEDAIAKARSRGNLVPEARATSRNIKMVRQAPLEIARRSDIDDLFRNAGEEGADFVDSGHRRNHLPDRKKGQRKWHREITRGFPVVFRDGSAVFSGNAQSPPESGDSSPGEVDTEGLMHMPGNLPIGKRSREAALMHQPFLIFYHVVNEMATDVTPAGAEISQRMDTSIRKNNGKISKKTG